MTAPDQSRLVLAVDYVNPFDYRSWMRVENIGVSYSEFNSIEEHLLGYRRKKWDDAVAKLANESNLSYGYKLTITEYLIYLTNVGASQLSDEWQSIVKQLRIDITPKQRNVDRCFTIKGHSLPYYVDDDDVWNYILSVLIPLIDVPDDSDAERQSSDNESIDTMGLTREAIVEYLNSNPTSSPKNRDALLRVCSNSDVDAKIKRLADGLNEEIAELRRDIVELKEMIDVLLIDNVELKEMISVLSIDNTDLKEMISVLLIDKQPIAVKPKKELSEQEEIDLATALSICDKLKVGATHMNGLATNIHLHSTRKFDSIKNYLFDDQTLEDLKTGRRAPLSPEEYVRIINDKIRPCGASIVQSSDNMNGSYRATVYLQSSNRVYEFATPVARRS